ncbi:MAG: acyl-CoA dehydrogenase, partial [Acidimicrobiia bacterium]
ASPTCVMSFGEAGDGAVGELVGELNGGMIAMFTMMNHARIGVAVEGLALAERAYQQARAYAAERLQGRTPATPKGDRAAIIEHPDVRRMLLTMQSTIEAMRRLIYATAATIDLGEHGADAETRERNEEIAALFTPLAKAWSTDAGFDVTSIGVQIHGGMGFIEETGAAQHLRDARIAMIYEGTNGIQAMDLVGRKLGMRGGGVVVDHFARIDADLGATDQPALKASVASLAAALAAAREATTYLAGITNVEDALAGATPYLRLLAMLTAGHLMLQSAVIATGTEREAAQLTTTRFFCEQLLPTATALVPSITAGAEALAIH